MVLKMKIVCLITFVLSKNTYFRVGKLIEMTIMWLSINDYLLRLCALFLLSLRQEETFSKFSICKKSTCSFVLIYF